MYERRMNHKATLRVHQYKWRFFKSLGFKNEKKNTQNFQK